MELRCGEDAHDNRKATIKRRNYDTASDNAGTIPGNPSDVSSGTCRFGDNRRGNRVPYRSLTETGGSDVADYPLTDALGSVRGLTDGAGAVSGTADYAVFGAARTTTGATSGFGFTGEQRDATTGFTFLRARYLDTASGRFTAADSMQPNAPGTQGWELYAYATGNPTTSTDPSGHLGMGTCVGIAQGVVLGAGFILSLMVRSAYYRFRHDARAWVYLAKAGELLDELFYGVAVLILCALSVAITGSNGSDSPNPNAPTAPDDLQKSPTNYPQHH